MSLSLTHIYTHTHTHTHIHAHSHTLCVPIVACVTMTRRKCFLCATAWRRASSCPPSMCALCPPWPGGPTSTTASGMCACGALTHRTTHSNVRACTGARPLRSRPALMGAPVCVPVCVRVCVRAWLCLSPRGHPVLVAYHAYREREALRLCLQHLRHRSYLDVCAGLEQVRTGHRILTERDA
jgi:hypothetical protein